LGPLEYPVRRGPAQGVAVPARLSRCRRCLLKGCERFFRPARPQSRYCSTTCCHAARRWRRWQASRRWRASAAGKARRREQCRRARQRIPLVVLPELPLVPEPVVPSPSVTGPPAPAACEGQRPATIPEKFAPQTCQRPGCYAVFVLRPRSPQQRFCSRSCRQALRRVLDRERRWRRRRRQGIRPRRLRSRPPP
jgi:hypothetical protein